MIERLVATGLLWVVTSKAAFAVFSAPAPTGQPVPFSEATPILVAVALAAIGLRYIGKRRK